jgi:hypothetical protein
MTDTLQTEAAGEEKSRRWFVILAIVVLVGFAFFVGAITVLSVRIPELKKPRYGVLEIRIGDRSA